MEQWDTLKEVACQARIDVLEMTYKVGNGHPANALSCMELMVYLYFHKMHIDPVQPLMPERDYFVLSKGHGYAGWYAVLAARGYFPRAELATLRQLGTRLQGHPSARIGLPGIEFSSGSLGNGFAVGIGVALGLVRDNKSNKVFVILGDGETQEGIVWEAALAANRFHLANVFAIVDNEGGQIDGLNSEIMPLEPYADKWQAFGWDVQDCDGHDFAAIDATCGRAEQVTDKPHLIIAKTIKGKGASYMEGKQGFSGIVPTREQLVATLKELGGEYEKYLCTTCDH
jgi:transketolase